MLRKFKLGRKKILAIRQITLFSIVSLSICSLTHAEDMNSQLFEAAKKGDSTTVEDLLSKGASVESRKDGQLTPLHVAAAYGHIKIVSLLIKKNANVNAVADQGVTPLHAASLNGHLKVVEMLLNNGANVNVRDQRNGFTPLHWASWKGHFEVARLLIEEGADVNSRMKQGQTPLMAAADHSHSSIISLLLSNGADLEAKKADGQTALISMAFSGNINMVHFLLSRGAKVNARDNKGSTALIGASYQGYNEIVDALLRNGADVNAKESDGQTALMCAAYKGHIDIAEKLIAQGADINVKKKDGTTAINAAEAAGKENMIRLLKGEEPKLAIKASPLMKRWAVIIGIGKYHDTRIPPLRYASLDAKSFYNWIISPQGGKYPPAQVKLLLDEDATGKNIKSALFAWLKQAIEEDMVTIYFAGHGSPDSPDSLSNLFLLPFDTQYDDISTTGFPMWDIETALKRFIKARKVIVIADACHAGGIGQSFDIDTRSDRGIKINPIGKHLEGLSKFGDGICVLNAADEAQFSREGENWGGGHGVFTYFLLKGLHGEADYNNDSSVTLGELIPFISENVRRATKNAQTPTVAGKFDPALSIAK